MLAARGHQRHLLLDEVLPEWLDRHRDALLKLVGRPRHAALAEVVAAPAPKVAIHVDHGGMVLAGVDVSHHLAAEELRRQRHELRHVVARQPHEWERTDRLLLVEAADATAGAIGQVFVLLDRDVLKRAEFVAEIAVDAVLAVTRAQQLAFVGEEEGEVAAAVRGLDGIALAVLVRRQGHADEFEKLPRAFFLAQLMNKLFGQAETTVLDATTGVDEAVQRDDDGVEGATADLLGLDR